MSKSWKWIEGFEGSYEISDEGDVKSYRRSKDEGNILKPSNQNGYLKVVLNNGGKSYHRRVHRLVAFAFLDKPEHKNQVNHINGDKHDNRDENLEWTTPAENTRHAINSGFLKVNENKLDPEKVKAIRFLDESGFSRDSLSRIFNVTPSNIYQICERKTWKHVN